MNRPPLSSSTPDINRRIESALAGRRIGDALLLAGELSDALAGAKARIAVARALCAVGNRSLGLELLDAVPDLSDAERAKAACDDAPAKPVTTGRVLLFSGHMIDAPDRTEPRFPPSKENAAADAIAGILDRLTAGPDDMALTQGACGGDLLFTEACQSRGIDVRWMQPYPEPYFIENSVLIGGQNWRDRYLAAKDRLSTPIRCAPAELGAPPADAGPYYAYERCNLWLLYTALSSGLENMRLITLWNGRGGNGPGGTAHMVDEVKRRSGRVDWIDTRNL